VPADAERLANSSGWIVPSPTGSHWIAAARGDNLVLASSRMEVDSLRAWLGGILGR
jgi:hypothetical protein